MASGVTTWHWVSVTVAKSMAFYSIPRRTNSSSCDSRRDSHPEIEHALGRAVHSHAGAARAGKAGYTRGPPPDLRAAAMKA